ncbi:MAG TPA: N-acetylmuramoyl-L-alanine amidase [Actinomycetota bacterium]|nr:N-acetylmuramoyl-L-alanine amidase [Actinomycetota bacterium]
MQTIRRGDRGDHVRDVHARLLALGFHIDAFEIDDHRFDGSTEGAIRAFQQERGLLVDGLVGPETWEELVEAGFALGDRVLYLRRPNIRGDDVRALQRRLNILGFDPGREDGIFGDQTAQAVRDFQRNVGLRSDGIVGPTTLEALDRLLAAPVTGPGRAAVRETETVRVGSGSLTGRTVAVDPGHGPHDPGSIGPAGTREADAVYRVAEALLVELRLRGSDPRLLRGAAEDPDASERAARANRAGAEVLVSVHLNSHVDASAEGSSAYYFGGVGASSVAGATLAELVQDELTSATGLRDGRTHPKAFPILRETRMPAVQIEPCFLTNPKEEQLLSEEGFVRDVAVAIATALERYFAGQAAGTIIRERGQAVSEARPERG